MNAPAIKPLVFKRIMMEFHRADLKPILSTIKVYRDSGEQVGYIYWDTRNRSFAFHQYGGTLFLDEMREILAQMNLLTEWDTSESGGGKTESLELAAKTKDVATNSKSKFCDFDDKEAARIMDYMFDKNEMAHRATEAWNERVQKPE